MPTMRSRSLLAVAFSLVIAAVHEDAAHAAPPPAPAAPVVIILSWDGTRWDYPDRIQSRGLARMQREGARAERLVPVFPSLTFPNHVALATGTYTDRHGIIANSFTDRAGRSYAYSADASWIEAEPLWIAAERQGVHAATFFWVGSETDWHGQSARYRRAPFDTKVSESEKVKQILEWIDLPQPERPGLIMAWWHGCDSQGHQLGPDAPEIATQLRAQDDQLVALLDGLDKRHAWDHVTLLVVSDHGMTGYTELLDVGRALAAASIKARVQAFGGSAEVYLDDPTQATVARAALSSLKKAHAYTNAERPPELRSYFPGRSGDLLVVAEPPSLLVAGAERKQPRDATHARGMHGYRPDHPDMGAIFFALGRGILAHRHLGAVRAIDVAPTAAALLNIAPPAQSEGKPIFQMP